MKWDIVSFKSIGPVRYGMTESDILQLFGEPKNKARRPDLEYHFNGFTVRFNGASQRVDELSIFDYEPSNEVFYGERQLDWEGRFVLDLCRIDGEPRESHGYIFLLNIGIALVDFFDDYERPAITGFESPYEEEKRLPLVDMSDLKCRVRDAGVLK